MEENKTAGTTGEGAAANTIDSTEVMCSKCGRRGAVAEFTGTVGKDKKVSYMCAECKAKMIAEIEAEGKDINMPKALGFGIVAGIIAAIAWYFIVILSGYEIGYVALGVGYLIGFAVYLGAGKKRSQKLQILAGVIALVAIFFAEHAIFTHEVGAYIQAHIDQFPNMAAIGGTPKISFFDPLFLESFVTPPIGFVIYAIGVYIAYRFPKPKKV